MSKKIETTYSEVELNDLSLVFTEASLIFVDALKKFEEEFNFKLHGYSCDAEIPKHLSIAFREFKVDRVNKMIARLDSKLHLPEGKEARPYPFGLSKKSIY